MFIVLIYRPEADGWHGTMVMPGSHPFSGIEVLGVYNSVEEANKAIDIYQAGREWKFHIEQFVTSS